MSDDERLVRHYLRPAPADADEALTRILEDARAEGYAQAKEQADAELSALETGARATAPVSANAYAHAAMRIRAMDPKP